MNFKLGEKYIVNVTENGIIPLMKFDRDRWFDKDCDSLDFLTDEEKEAVVNEVLDRIKQDILNACMDKYYMPVHKLGVDKIFEIIDKYKVESEESES